MSQAQVVRGQASADRRLPHVLGNVVGEGAGAPCQETKEREEVMAKDYEAENAELEAKVEDLEDELGWHRDMVESLKDEVARLEKTPLNRAVGGMTTKSGLVQ